MHNVLLKHSKAVFFLFVAIALCLQNTTAQVLPLEQKNTLNENWLVQDNTTGQLVPLTGQDDEKAIHQWVYIENTQPFQVSFAAPQGLSLFLNNRLVFTATSAGTYSVDLAQFSKRVKPSKGRYLLTIWHPERQPNVKTFHTIQEQLHSIKSEQHESIAIRAKEYVSQHAFIILLLVLGLIYGFIRTNYPSDFASVFSPGSFVRTSALQEGLLAKPIGSWVSIMFVLAFSLSLALVVVAVHTNVHQLRFFNQLLPVSGADILTKVLVYAGLIFIVILLKYLFIKVMGFIFGLEQVVELQYREFVRTLLFLGIFLPLIMIFYLVYNTSAPGNILVIVNIMISLLLIVTTIRVSVTVNTQATVLNLHLFSYLCATEVIPLAIMLKLIVLNF